VYFDCHTYLGMSFPGFPTFDEFTPISLVPAILAGLTAAVLIYVTTGRRSGTSKRTAAANADT
jgi:hypothetical protein